jgi:hypothetical protein
MIDATVRAFITKEAVSELRVGLLLVDAEMLHRADCPAQSVFAGNDIVKVRRHVTDSCVF